MKIFPALLCLPGLLLIGSPADLKADSLSGILARMDQAAPAFHALRADLVMDTYQQIIDSHTKENGSLEMQRLKKADTRAIITFTGNSARTLAFQGRIVRIYYPALNEYQDVSLGTSASAVNQFLLLGFGSSGQELQQSYTLTDEGQEKVAGSPSTKLLLVPRDKAVLEKLPKVELWIPEDGANPVQQKFYEQSGNYRTITYSNMQINPALNGPLELKLPKDAKKQRK